MYDGDLTTDDMAQILKNNDNVDYLPTTEQDAVHTEKDGQFGRHYNEQFDPDQLGRRGTQVLNDPVNDARQPHRDHFDVVDILGVSTHHYPLSGLPMYSDFIVPSSR